MQTSDVNPCHESSGVPHPHLKLWIPKFRGRDELNWTIANQASSHSDKTVCCPGLTSLSDPNTATMAPAPWDEVPSSNALFVLGTGGNRYVLRQGRYFVLGSNVKLAAESGSALASVLSTNTSQHDPCPHI